MANRRKPDPIPESKKLSANDIRRALTKIKRRIEELEAFDFSKISKRTDPEAEALRVRINSNLADIFGDGTAEYRRHFISDLSSLPIIIGREWYPNDYQHGAREGFNKAIVHLRGLVYILDERLEDLNQSASEDAEKPVQAQQVHGRRIFVVHGHDDGARLEVEAFLRKLKFEPVVLHDQANGGRTIIEKLEKHTSDVDFAVILLTPDDEARPVGGDLPLKPRARQNVVLELGLFYGLLGRTKVCALHKGDLELPSDFQGVLYTHLDPNGGWRISLAREMRAAGLDVDMNHVV